MARDIWIVSDTHFRHENILKFTDSRTGNRIRPEFDTVEDMDEFMVDRWNSVVKPGDYVYHLGDVMMGPKEGFVPFFNRLRGSKRITFGNHDDIKWLSSTGMFAKSYIWRVFKEHGLIMSHIPIHSSSLKLGEDGEPMINVHGHIHQNDSPAGPYVNLSVEKINYTPVNIEEVRSLWKKQQSELKSLSTDTEPMFPTAKETG